MEGSIGQLLVAALGLYLVIEGAVLALFPNGMQRVLARVQQIPPATLRGIGLVSAAAGVAMVWLARL